MLRGDLDLASADEFDRAMASAQEATPASITLDLTALDFLDSCGLRSILTAQRLCSERGCELTLIPGEQAQRLFDLTGLSDKLPLSRPTDRSPNYG